MNRFPYNSIIETIRNDNRKLAILRSKMCIENYGVSNYGVIRKDNNYNKFIKVLREELFIGIDNLTDYEIFNRFMVMLDHNTKSRSNYIIIYKDNNKIFVALAIMIIYITIMFYLFLYYVR